MDVAGNYVTLQQDVLYALCPRSYFVGSWLVMQAHWPIAG